MAGRDPLGAAVRRRVAVKRRAEPLDEIERVLDHRFADGALLLAALTHPSTGETSRGPYSYERLEFLGDRVLGLVVAELLLARYPNEDEGALTRRLTALVRREAVLDAARSIELARFVRTSAAPSEKERDTVLADGTEALIGAIYLDAGLPPAATFVQRVWAPLVQAMLEPARDAKTALQEWVQARGRPLPVYEIVGQEGPAHQPVFTVQVAVGNAPAAIGTGSSKRAAEQDAAAALLARLEANA